jgi:outer membrane autotransporter protein
LRAVTLGTAEDFGVLGGSTVTNTGATVINGSVGVSPGSSITGFPPGVVVNGTIHANDGIAIQAHADASTAFTQLGLELVTTNLTGQNLGGLTLTPGTYRFDNNAQLTGTLSLNAGADPNAVFNFQIGSDLTTATDSTVLLLNGSSSNVFWQIGTSATLGINSSFLGTIIADQSITLTTGATLDGRALAINGAVTLDQNSVVIPIVPQQPLAPGRFWSGDAGNLWSGANWSPDASGATSSTLAPVADVVFSVTGIPPQNQSTIVDTDVTISSLTVNDPAAVTISGPGVLSIVGTGSATGITINSGAGLTTINTALALSGPAQAMTVNNAAGLVINGAISGADGLTKGGAGTLTLGGANTYAGATAILQGVLQAGAANVIPSASAMFVQQAAQLNLNGLNQSVGSLEGAGGVDLGGASLVTGNDNTSTLYAGVISGAGSVEKVGNGSFELTGANTYIGLTTVRAGVLEVNGSIAGSAHVAGGILRGGGTIGGSVTSRSVVEPGRAGTTGTLSIGGDYRQSSGGTLNVQLASSTNYDRLSIGGKASLGGILNLSYLDGFEAEAGDEFTILTARGGVSGTFAAFDDAHFTGTLLDLSAVYRSNSVVLQFTQGSFADLADDFELTSNEQAVAEALDELAADQPGNDLIAELNTLQLAQIPGALSLISAEDLAAIFTTGLAVSQVQIGNLERRLDEVRRGESGFSDSGFAVTDSHGGQNYDGKSTVNFDGKTFASLDGKSTKEGEQPIVERQHRWGFFISGTGTFGDVESTSQARGSSFTTGGISVGADYRVNRHFVIGAALGYANTSSDLSRGGNLAINSGKASLYATYHNGSFYVNGIVSGGYGTIDTKRRTIGGFADGRTDATDFSALLGTGYDVHLGAFTVGPVASIQYGTAGIDGFTERGALGALRINEQSQDSLTSAVGVKAAYTQRLGRMSVTPQIRAQWQHEYLDDSSSIDAGFSSRSSFSVGGPELGRDALLLDVGASAQLSSHVAIFGFYTGELGRENYTAHSINGGVRVSF